MSFAALFMMAESKGWVVVIASTHQGADMHARDGVAYLRTLAIYESREEWHSPNAKPLVSVRLDQPEINLDHAAAAIVTALQATGVV